MTVLYNNSQTPAGYGIRTNLHVVLMLPLFLFLNCAVSPAVIAQETIAERKDSVRAFFRDADVGMNYAAAAGNILSPDTRADGLQMLEELTTTISPDIIERYRMTAAYVHLHSLISDSMRQRIEYIWGHIPVRPFDGEHERVAYHTALHLMTCFAGEDAVFFNGKSMRENEHESRAFLLDWIREVTELGQRDFDSPTYGAVTVAAMLLLRDFALDEELRRTADLMAHWLLADFAHDYLNGSYCGAHAREYIMSAMNPAASDMSGLGWLYFAENHRMYGREQFFAALSDFEPHPAIVEVATRRAVPFESWERKRTAHMYRDARNFTLHPDPARAKEDVVRYTYMDPLYAIGSIPGGLIQPREQHTWDVTWISDDPEKPATLFLMHPYSDAEALRPFMPHTTDLAMRTVGLLDPYFGTATKTVGGSPFEDVFQYKNTLIALYDIGDISRFPVIAGFLPLELQALDIDSIHTQWITINTGDVYIGMYPLAPFRIVDGMYGKHYFSSHKRNGVIVHVAGRNVAGSYEQFREQIRSTAVDTSRFATDLHVRYTTPDGDRLAFTYGGERSVNDRTPSMQDELLFDSPLLHSRRGSGILTIRARAGDVLIDMKAGEIREGT